MTHTHTLRLLAALIPASMLLSGCGRIGHRITGGAITALQEQEATVSALEHRLADTLASYLGDRIKEEVLAEVRTSWSGMRSEMISGIDTSLSHVSAALREDVNQSLQILIADNLDLLDRKSEAIADSLAVTLSRAMSDEVGRLLASLADSVGFNAMKGVRRGIEDQVNPALAKTLEELRLLVREQVKLLIAPERKASTEGAERPWWGRLGFGVGILALIWIGAVHFHHSRELKRLGRGAGTG
ncbi:MAG: hypothetical protein ACE5GJ_13565 [Gemmatimonadota bacterium]